MSGPDPSRDGYIIESGIPIPAIQSDAMRVYGRPKYPWSKMREGDSFFVPGDGRAQQQIKLSSATARRCLRHDGERYVTRKVEGGVRVWRVPCDSDGPRMAETTSARGEAGPARAEGIAK